MTLEQKILARIKTENLKPTARGWFKARDVAFWALLVLSVAALGIGLGMVIFMIESMDLTLLESLELTAPQRIFASVPLFWILASIALAVFAFLNFRQTRKGYKISGRRFTAVAVGIGVIIGLAVYTLNFTNYLDEVASQNLPLYNVVVPISPGTWYDPDNGLLSGTVRERFSDTEFTLRDREAVLWQISGENMIVPPGFTYGPGDRVRIIGERTGVAYFHALQIHPWRD